MIQINLIKLMDAHFAETIVIRDYEAMERNLSRISDRKISENEIEIIFKTINEQIDFFKLNLGINGLTASNLFSYTYDATNSEQARNGSGTRKRITNDLHLRLLNDRKHFIPITELLNDDEPSQKDFAKTQLSLLIGHEHIKREIEGLTALAKIRKLKSENGIPTSPTTLHMVFYGNPGTGKTTVARLIGAIYKDIGLLEKGHVIEASRVDLVERHIGHTAKKVQETFQEALGGVLFIDEAYALNNSDSERDFGKEAIDTIVKLTEDLRDQIVVIMAGYKDEMDKLISSNPGLKSRFSTYIHFPDYSLEELTQIFEKNITELDHILTMGARLKIEILLEELHKKRKLDGNARDVRNIFDRTMLNQANRLKSLASPTNFQLREIQPEDIPDWYEN